MIEDKSHISYKNRCYIYVKSKSVLTCKVCKSKTRFNTYRYTYKGRLVKGFANYCPGCKAFLIDYDKYIQDIEHWEVLNSEESIQRLSDMYKKVAPNKKDDGNKKESLLDFEQRLSEARKRLKEQNKRSLSEDRKEKQQLKKTNTPQFLMTTKQVKVPYSVNKPTETRLNSYKHDIDAHDFIVRSFSTVFRCRNKGHTIKDVRATFKTITKKGTIATIEIPAGYCSQCNMYFILESTYHQIKQCGIPICRMIDEKKYMTNGIYNSTNYSNFAQESVLMQFGYTVSQVEDLQMIQRRALLATIVDYNVLTKNEVVSYLDYFIKYRKNQKNPDGSLKYGLAIDKWKNDREFISKYKIGTYTEVAMKRIITNKRD